MKKFTFLLLLSVFLFSSATSAFASTISPQLETLIKEYNLEVVEQFPDGVTPVEYESVAEAEKALANIKNNAELSVEMADINTEKAQNSDTNQALDGITPLANGSQKYTHITPPFTRNLDVYYTYHWNGQRNLFSSCTKISSYITGITLGFTWTQTGSTHSIMDGGRTLYARANAKLDHYLIIEGVGTIFTTKESIDNFFYNP